MNILGVACLRRWVGRSVLSVQGEEDGVAPARALLPHRSVARQGHADCRRAASELAPAVVERTALLDRLLDAREQVIAVTAPAGYGKTTLLSDWAERRGARVALGRLRRDRRQPRRTVDGGVGRPA